MRDRKDLNTLSQLFVNNSIRKTSDTHSSNRLLEKRETVGLQGDGILRRAKGMQKISCQLRPVTRIPFGCRSKLNIGFAMQDDGFHSMAA